MLNVLKTDIYKIFRTPSFWVCLAFSIFFTLFLSFATAWSFVDPTFSELYQIGNLESEFFNNAASIMFSSCSTLISIFAVIFTVHEFSFGTIKNTISRGIRREYIYASKFLTSFFVAIIHYVISFITSFMVCQVMVNNKIPNFFNYSNEFHESLLKNLLTTIAYISIALLIGTLLRSQGPASSCFLVLFTLGGTAVLAVEKLINSIFDINMSLRQYYIDDAFSNPAHTTQGVIVLLAYIVVTTAIGIYAFKKRDI